MNLTYGQGQRFPGLKVFGAIGIGGVFKNHLMVNYAPSISIYTKTIGTNLNPLVGDIQIDFTNSFSFGVGWAGSIGYQKYFRTIHTGDYYNVGTDRRNAVLITANYILNNHKRNQIVGAVSASFDNITVNYANDGAPPFDKIPVADNFDRYWTGSAGIFLHNKKSYNTGELSFDQFTGYTPLLYEVSGLLGINLPLYDDISDSIPGKKKQPYSFNTSAYNLRVGLDKNYNVDIGILGSLVKRGKYYGLQDIIHKLGHYPMHPNNDDNRIYVGATYLNMQHVKL